MTTSLRGKVSWFGGPQDLGVSPAENLAFIYSVSDQPSLFLSEQPEGTTGLARRLDPATFYVATRWDYDVTSKSELLDLLVEVRNPKTGKTCIARPADWGPHQDTNRVADVSSGLLAYLDLVTDDEIEIVYPAQGVQPMTDIPICIDISHWQDFPDMEEVYASGVRGLIHKATEGTTYRDPNRSENCSNAKAAGLAISTYFWIKPGDGRAQAEFYISTIDPVPGERVVIDYEEDGCSLATLHDAVQALLDYGQDLQITVYSGHLLKEQLGNDCDDFLAANTDLWLAQYTDDEDDISWCNETYPQWALWQYSETGQVPGIDDSYVDFNNFNGHEEAFLNWINPAGSTPTPPKPPEPDDRSVVTVAITAPDNVKVGVTINDRKVVRPRRGLLKKLRAARRGPDIVR
jgi:GH25 family lysozyme M1 (1,4-beta-N-acetylmuramidase)